MQGLEMEKREEFNMKIMTQIKKSREYNFEFLGNVRKLSHPRRKTNKKWWKTKELEEYSYKIHDYKRTKESETVNHCR